MTETTLIYILTAVTGVLAACIIFLMISNKNLIKKIEDMDKSDQGYRSDAAEFFQDFWRHDFSESERQRRSYG